MSVISAYRRLLRNGALTRLLIGEFVSSIGDWLYLVAVLIVVYQESGSAVVLGIIGAARVVPYIVLSVPAGMAADRFDRRMILIVTDVARGVVMVALAVLVFTDGPLALFVALTIAATCFSSFFGPAIGSFLPTLVDESELGPANSAWATLDNLAFVIGPAIAGVLIAAGGLGLAFVLNAISFGIVALILWRLPRPARDRAGEADAPADPATAADRPADLQPAQAPAPQPDLRGMLRPLGGLTLINVVGGFVFGGLSVLTVVIAVDVLGGGESATGFLNAAIGVGGLVGAMASGALVLRRRLAPPLVVGGLLLGIGVLALGQTHSLALALFAMALAATGSMLVEVVSTTLFQRVVPDAVRGRALGVMETVAIGAYAAGAFLLPVLAAPLGVPTILAVSGIAIVVACVAGAVLVGSAATQQPEPLDPLRARLVALPIFAGLPPARLEAAGRQLTTVPVRRGDVIIRQGDRADRFYLIVSGSYLVTQQERPDGPPHELRRMGPDEVFGEIGLLTGSPRTATVTATDDGLLLALDGARFLELTGSGPGLTSRLLDLHRGATPAAIG